jgi:Right handed beta helix region
VALERPPFSSQGDPMKYTSIFALTLLAAVPALAQPYDITWVSQRSGNDANPFCTITTPCQTFQQAYAKTNPGGIVKALDAGEYGRMSITTPIIIDGNGVGAAIEVTMANSQGVFVSSSGAVEIRNLTIHVPASCGSCIGIESFSNLSIENVSITGQPGAGVFVNGGTATIHGLTVTGATNNGIIVQNATATISDSIVRYSNYGISLFSPSAVTQVLIERSKMISNNIGLSAQNGGFAATARISDSVITDNNLGVSTSNGGQIITFRNNAWAGNIGDGTTPFSLSLK